jgi:MFS family permease
VLTRAVGLADFPPDFRRLWSASVASNLSDGIAWVALSLAAVRLTTDPLLIAAVSVAEFLPDVLFVLVAGALADRVDRRRVLLRAELLRFVTLGGLVVLTVLGVLSLPALIVGAFMLSLAQTFYDTTSQALVQQVADKATLTRANARLYGAETLTNTFIGPPLGGALIAIGVALAFGGALFGYALAVIGLWRMTGSYRAERVVAPSSVRREIVEGLAWLVHHPLQRTLTLMVTAGSLAAGIAYSVFVLYAVAPGPMGLSDVGYGVLLTAIGAGSLVGAVFAERIERRLGTSTSLILAHVGFAAGFFVPAITAEPVLVGIGFAVNGFSSMVWNVVNVSLRQRFIPSALYGRVHAGHRLLARSGALIGSVLGGVLATLFGLPVVFAVATVVVIVSCLGGLVVNERNIATALAAGAPDEAAGEPVAEALLGAADEQRPPAALS